MMGAAGYLSEACRLFVLIVLLSAAAGKTLGFARFRTGLVQSFPGMGNAGSVVALAIVVIEWLIGALILSSDQAMRGGLLAALTLFLLFAAVIAWALIQGRAITCSCFGASSHRITGYDLLRNFLFMSASMFAWQQPSPSAAMDPTTWVALAGMALIAFLISSALHDVVLLLRARIDG